MYNMFLAELMERCSGRCILHFLFTKIGTESVIYVMVFHLEGWMDGLKTLMPYLHSWVIDGWMDGMIENVMAYFEWIMD